MDANNDYDAEEVYWSHAQVQDLRWWLQLPQPWYRSFRTQPFTDEFHE
jgi:hypothetical protein